ncbi:AraC family transcriptional regulator [Bacillus sp. MRMR6]|nr:AraC family transcriptional regulator [Bacillus sp. MRMR6]
MDTVKKQDGFDSEKILVLPKYVVDEVEENSLVKSLYLTDIGYFPLAKYHYRERNEGCNTYILIYCADGEGWVELEGSNLFKLKANMFVVIPAGTPHRYGASEKNPWSIYWFHIKGTEVEGIIETFGLTNGPIEIPFSGGVKLAELFHECYETLIHKTYSLQHHLLVSQTMKYLLSTIGLLSIRTQQEVKSNYYIEKAIQYMNEHLHQQITLQDVSDFIGLSKQHLIFLFKQETSFTPIDYFLRLKIHRSCQMLDLTNLTIKQIALSVGMDDPYYFSRVFKKIIGCSPSQYRSNKKG